MTTVSTAADGAVDGHHPQLLLLIGVGMFPSLIFNNFSQIPTTITITEEYKQVK